MTFDVEVRERRHHVEVVRTSSGDHVSIDGQMFSSHMVGSAAFWSLFVGDGTGGADASPFRSYEVAFELDEATGILAVSVDGTTIPVRLVDRRRSRPRSALGDLLTGAQALRAPMPGRIVAVHAVPGQRVTAHQSLIVMEAMKMENELQAPLAGTVTDVLVDVGQAVEAGQVLAVVSSETETKA